MAINMDIYYYKLRHQSRIKLMHNACFFTITFQTSLSLKKEKTQDFVMLGERFDEEELIFGMQLYP